jgi:hypothetical protein
MYGKIIRLSNGRGNVRYILCLDSKMSSVENNEKRRWEMNIG